MITAKESVKIALSYVEDFFPEAKGVGLEEIEFDVNKNSWAITISFLDTDGYAVALLSNKRKYKSIFVNAETGKVEAMKIRSLA